MSSETRGRKLIQVMNLIQIQMEQLIFIFFIGIELSNFQNELDDYFYGDTEEDHANNINLDSQHILHRKTTQELDEEAKNVVKHVTQSAKEKNENVDDKKKFWKNYIKLLV